MLAAAAAAAAAEAAARDAAETEAQQGSDAVLSVAMSAMAGDGGDAASTMGQDLYGHEQQLGGYEAPTSMAVEPMSEVGMDHLLQQMVAEQQQVEREQQFREQLAAAAVAEAARLNRPHEHFITIASNGEFPSSLTAFPSFLGQTLLGNVFLCFSRSSCSSNCRNWCVLSSFSSHCSLTRSPPPPLSS